MSQSDPCPNWDCGPGCAKPDACELKTSVETVGEPEIAIFMPIACADGQHLIVVGEATCRCGVYVAETVRPGPWLMHACRGSDGKTTGRYNVARPSGEIRHGVEWPGVFPLWEHAGPGDFTPTEARALVERLNAEARR